MGLTSANPHVSGLLPKISARNGADRPVRHPYDAIGRVQAPQRLTPNLVPHPAGVVGPHGDLDPVAGADLG